INDLKVTPDISLSEGSYTFRQRAVLSWTATSASDFSRYRIRKGINRSQASDHAHLRFVNSRGTTSYLDTTLYTDGSTIYYSIYAEDGRNKSASTNANVSNIVSWTKPKVQTVGYGPTNPNVLTQVSGYVSFNDVSISGRQKKAKIVWG